MLLVPQFRLSVWLGAWCFIRHHLLILLPKAINPSVLLGDIVTVYLHSCGLGIKICVHSWEFSVIFRGRVHSWEDNLKIFNNRIIIIPTRLKILWVITNLPAMPVSEGQNRNRWFNFTK
jgi:hypothetical protein